MARRLVGSRLVRQVLIVLVPSVTALVAAGLAGLCDTTRPALATAIRGAPPTGAEAAPAIALQPPISTGEELAAAMLAATEMRIWALDVPSEPRRKPAEDGQGPEVVSPYASAYHVDVDRAGREYLAAVVRDHVHPYVLSMDMDLMGPPYPWLEIGFRVPPWEVRVNWFAPGNMGVGVRDPTDPSRRYEDVFLEHDAALWLAVSALAALPDPRPGELGYLFKAERVETVVDGKAVEPGPITSNPLRRVRMLKQCTVPAGPAPDGPAPAVIRFFIRGELHEVRVWDYRIAYAGRAYDCPRERPGLLERLREPVNVP